MKIKVVVKPNSGFGAPRLGTRGPFGGVEWMGLVALKFDLGNTCSDGNTAQTYTQ